MKVDNHFDNRRSGPCGSDGIALFARPVGDVLQGAAADCNSAVETAYFHQQIKTLSQRRVLDNTPGHSGNAPETLTTGIGHPYDNLPCHLIDKPRPTAAAIVVLCMFAGVAGAFGLALWGLV